MFENGSKPVKMAGGPISFYEEYTTTSLYVERVFGGGVNSININNDSTTDTVSVSFDGATVEAELKPGESLTLNTATKNSIYIRGATGGGKIRSWAW